VEVALEQPALRWQGHAYLDSNEGDEPIDRPFVDWDWSRATLPDGSTAVVYDVRQRDGLAGGRERLVAHRFLPDGSHHAFDAPARRPLPRSAWRVVRHTRSEADPAPPPRVLQTLEDTPFYVRSMIDSTLLGQRVTSMHESLDLPRLVSPVVRLMLPFRMPRRG
jgi:carotenoid 1,2-hydratase